MATLLANFSIGEIVLFAVLLALAVKGLIEFSQWAWTKMKDKVHNSEKAENMIQDVKNELSRIEKTHVDNLEELKERDDKLQNNIDNLSTDVKDLTKSVNLLIESDKADILAWITQQHHYFSRLGWIDEFSLLTIEKRFKYYKCEGGNSFAEDLMKDIRNLPKKSPREEDNIEE